MDVENTIRYHSWPNNYQQLLWFCSLGYIYKHTRVVMLVSQEFVITVYRQLNHSNNTKLRNL